jgi:uncharacterized protein involved in high-affinity Fe2+ transport|tara:strand:+ start:2328 stop:2873 length:546 start_codon:yes stop_codon:yes gene_type:complete
MRNLKLIIYIFLTVSFSLNAQELVIAEERVEPGIIFVFEGAIKDHIMPSSMHLKENQTNVHIEARVNWDINNVPAGTPLGGFIPYLHITAKVTNEKSGLSTFIDLLPHINLIDNFHYARNISLPGAISDLYSVDFNIIPPTQIELALHNDWAKMYGKELFTGKTFKYINVDFEEIANARRN